MKSIWIVIFCIASGTLAFGQSKLEVTITNIKEEKGSIRVGLFSDSKTFLKEPTIGKVVKAKTGEVKVVFENVPSGTYGVSVIHDANENGSLDSNAIGMPTEGFGFGNDAMGMFGPPKFEKASIQVGAASTTISIAIRYL